MHPWHVTRDPSRVWPQESEQCIPPSITFLFWWGELRQAAWEQGLPWTRHRPRQDLLLACGCTPTSFGTFRSGRRCFQGGGGRDLPSSGGVALTVGKVPCEFRADPPTFIFSGGVETSSLPARPAEDGAPSTAGLATVLQVYSDPSKIKSEVGTCRLRGVLPAPWGMSPVSFEPIGPPLFFREKGPGSAAPPGKRGASSTAGRDLAHPPWSWHILHGDGLCFFYF